MLFWLCLLGFVGVEVSYDLLSDGSYFWFANAEQAQSAILGLLLFSAIGYRYTIRKIAAFLLAVWLAVVALAEWALAFNLPVAVSVFVLLLGWGAYAAFKIRAVQGKPKAD